LSEANELRSKRQHEAAFRERKRNVGALNEGSSIPASLEPPATDWEKPGNHPYISIATGVADYAIARSRTSPELWKKRISCLRFKSLHKLVEKDGTLHHFALKNAEMHIEKNPKIVENQEDLKLRVLRALDKTFPPKMPRK